jgi:Protein of unknown function (DUF3293)
MGWDNYIRAVLCIELPEGTLRIKPAPLGKSHDINFPDSTCGTIHVITAFNPGGITAPDAANVVANERLTTRLQKMGKTCFAAAGGDVDWTHVERGFAVIGMTDEEALALGRDFAQEAIYGWSPSTLTVLSCDTGKIHMTGWDVVTNPASHDVEEFLDPSVRVETEPPPSDDPDQATKEVLAQGPEYDSPGALPEPDGETTREEFLAKYPGEESLAEIYFPDDENE